MAPTHNEGIWKRFAIAMLIFAAAASTLTYLNHQRRVELEEQPAAVITNRAFTVSKESKKDLVNFMRKEPSIVAISTISISLITNRRDSSFFESEDPNLQAEWQHYRDTRTSLTPVFTNDAHANSRITRIINGNFECRKTIETVIPNLYHAEKYAATTCSISVPVGFDKSADFVGYINFFINRETITDSEQARLSKGAIELSTKIYERDLSQHKK